MTIRRLSLLIYTVLLIVCVLALKSCYDGIFKDVPATESVDKLPEDTRIRVHLTPNQVTVQNKDRVVKKYLPTQGSVSVEVKEDGTTKVDIKNKGFTFEPQLGLLVQDRLYAHIGFRLAYWNRWGLVAGGGASLDRKAIGYVGASYMLDQIKLRNTSVFIAYTTKREMAVGVSVRL